VPQKNRLKPWQTRRFCIPEADRPRFVAQMEEVLDVYCEAYDEIHPLICMDEAAKQVTSDVVPPLPLAPGQPRREDHHYERVGVQALFLFFDPLRGWRRVHSRDSRTRGDWADEVRRLLDEDYPQAERVTLVCDNLNIHDIASLYAAYDATTAHRLARRLRIVHTPRNGSWLNMAEIELSVLTRQCIGRRFQNVAQMQSSIAAWQQDRNAQQLGANWRFTTPDARIKLKGLYPVPDK
jgi:hypothetical protein